MRALRVATVAGLVAVSAAAPAAAQTLPGPAADTPLRLEAGGGVTWDRPAGTLVATGGARARYGGMTLAGERLTAVRAAEASDAPVKRVRAQGEARFISAELTVAGARGVVDLAREHAEVSGSPATFAAPEGSGRAGARMVYDGAARVLRLLGGAVVTHGAYTLRGETLVARFAAPAEPGDGPFPRPGPLARVEATGAVELAGPEGTATGQRGVYDAQARQAVLSGGIRLTRGGSTIAGEAVRLNLATGSSEVTSAQDSRVRALLRREDFEGQP